MDNNLTLPTGSLVFSLQYSDKTGSSRRNVTRGVNLPEYMLVKHQSYKDSLTGLPGNQSALIFEYHKALADGRIAAVCRATVKVQTLVDSNVGSAEVQAVLARVVDVLQEDDSGLDLGDEIFVNQEQ
jgi:hypothetical protein